jgi:hypothetical protein
MWWIDALLRQGYTEGGSRAALSSCKRTSTNKGANWLLNQRI